MQLQIRHCLDQLQWQLGITQMALSRQVPTRNILSNSAVVLPKAITDQLDQDVRSGRYSINCPAQNDCYLEWVQHMAQASSIIHQGTSWLPDYQGT